MTTCLRSIRFNLHPKLALINGKRSTSNTGLPRVAHSSFLNEFLDHRNTWNTERTTHFPCASNDLLTLTRSGVLACIPALHMAVKPAAETPDDIMLRNTASSVLCSQLLEDDLHRDVIQRENYSVTVLSGTMQNAMQEATMWSMKPTQNAVSESSTVLSTGQSENGRPAQDSSAKPSEQQLDLILNRLTDTLPNLFVRPLDYSIYHPKIVFEDNLRGVTSHGISSYITQMSMLRVYGHFKFAYVKMELLKVTKHTEDGTVRIRWRIRGVPALKAMLQFWKFRLWNYNTVKDKEIDWYDGLSTFHVNGDGVIYRHVCDKMTPDEHKLKSTAPMAAKLALILGTIARPPLESLCSFSAADAKPHVAK